MVAVEVSYKVCVGTVLVKVEISVFAVVASVDVCVGAVLVCSELCACTVGGDCRHVC